LGTHDATKALWQHSLILVDGRAGRVHLIAVLVEVLVAGALVFDVDFQVVILRQIARLSNFNVSLQNPPENLYF
jgi:hypothetical protein